MLRGTNGIDLNKTLRLLYLLCFLASDADGKHLLLMRTEIAIYVETWLERAVAFEYADADAVQAKSLLYLRVSHFF